MSDVTSDVKYPRAIEKDGSIEMKKLILIIPYFGSLPLYFNFFLKSVEGVNLDVLFVTDLSVGTHPDNFHVLSMSIMQLEQLASEKLNTKVVLKSPIRLCDFKPMYGHIFEDYIKDYPYWAFGDCDLVYGRKMNDLVETFTCGKWDAASCRKNWSTGSFFVMRNDDRMRLFYQRCKNWREVASLQDEVFVNFDEIGNRKHYLELELGRITVKEATQERDCLTAALWRSGDIQFYHEDVNCEETLERGVIEMRSGDLTYNGLPITYFHFIKPKWRRFFTFVYCPYDEIGNYLIDDTGFYLSGQMLKWRKLIRVQRYGRAAIASLIGRVCA